MLNIDDVVSELKQPPALFLLASGAVLLILLGWGDYLVAKATGQKYHPTYQSEDSQLSESLTKAALLDPTVDLMECEPREEPQPIAGPGYGCVIKTEDGYVATSIRAALAKEAIAAGLAFTIEREGSDVEVLLQVDQDKLGREQAEAFIRTAAADLPSQARKESEFAKAQSLANMPEPERNRKSWE